jgi:hypothetical protein
VDNVGPLLSGWFHFPREHFFLIAEHIKPYVLLIREYGKTMDVTVEKLPKAIFDQIDKIVTSHGLKEL